MKYSEHELNIIRKYYPAGGCKECQKYISRSNDSIRHMAKEIGITRETGWRESKIELNEFFDLENIYHVYILGLIWGDGTISSSKSKKGINCNSGPNYCISVSLVENDAKDVESIFKNWKISKHKYKNEDWQIRQTFYISWKKGFLFLKDLDFGEKSIKSPTKILNLIKKDYQKYFYRGWADADGFSKGLKKRCFYICGDYKQDWSVLENFCKENDLLFNIERKSRINNKGKLNKASNFWFLKRKSILFFLNYIYDGKIFGLKRKYKNYQDYKQSFIRNHLNNYKYFPQFTKKYNKLN